jgi:alpha,alpha-trehalase
VLVAAARGADLAEERGDDKRAKRWRAGAEKITAEVLEKGVSARGVFRQHYKGGGRNTPERGRGVEG